MLFCNGGCRERSYGRSGDGGKLERVVGGGYDTETCANLFRVPCFLNLNHSLSACRAIGRSALIDLLETCGYSVDV